SASRSATASTTSAGSGGWLEPHPEERPQGTSRRMAARSAFAAILRGSLRSRLRMRHSAGLARRTMPDHFDSLETRDPAAREQDLFARLPAQIARAMSAPGWGNELGARHAN